MYYLGHKSLQFCVDMTWIIDTNVAYVCSASKYSYAANCQVNILVRCILPQKSLYNELQSLTTWDLPTPEFVDNQRALMLSDHNVPIVSIDHLNERLFLSYVFEAKRYLTNASGVNANTDGLYNWISFSVPHRQYFEAFWRPSQQWLQLGGANK